MKAIKIIIKWVVYSNLWIALGAGFLCESIFVRMTKSFNFHLSLFVFGATLFSYNFQRLSRISKIKCSINYERINWIVSNKKFLWIICFLGLSICLLNIQYLSINQLLFLVIPFLVSFLYSIGNFGLRNIPVMKIFWISSVWSSCVFMLFIGVKSIFQPYIFSIFTFFYIFSLCIPFDIRDLKYDDLSKRTIPQIFGIKVAKVISVALLIVNLILLYVFSILVWIDITFMILAIILILFSNTKRKELYYSGVIDGHILLYSLFVICWFGF